MARAAKVPGVTIIPIDWLDGVTGYFAGSDGKIYSEKIRSRTPEGSAYPLRQHILSTGYAMVGLSAGKTQLSAKVHRLVCRAFHGAPSDGQEVRHLDGSRLNNKPGNLAWGTRTENMKDAAEMGRTTRGAKNSTTKLSEADVLYIRKSCGVIPTKALAEKFGMWPQSIREIQRRETWSWLIERGELIVKEAE